MWRRIGWYKFIDDSGEYTTTIFRQLSNASIEEESSKNAFTIPQDRK
jgi:hypothetical protein